MNVGSKHENILKMFLVQKVSICTHYMFFPTVFFYFFQMKYGKEMGHQKQHQPNYIDFPFHNEIKYKIGNS